MICWSKYLWLTLCLQTPMKISVKCMLYRYHSLLFSLINWVFFASMCTICFQEVLRFWTQDTNWSLFSTQQCLPEAHTKLIESFGTLTQYIEKRNVACLETNEVPYPYFLPDFCNVSVNIWFAIITASFVCKCAFALIVYNKIDKENWRDRSNNDTTRFSQKDAFWMTILPIFFLLISSKMLCIIGNPSF